MVPLGSYTSVAGLITLGTFVSLAAKTVMFGGMCFCLPLALYLEKLDKAATAAENGGVNEPLLAAPGEVARPPAEKNMFLANLPIAIPTFFDLVATVLMNVGLLYVTASVYQMMRGAEMLFAALFAVVFLKRSLNKYHYSGILCCVIGIGLVGYASTMAGEGSAHHVVSQRDIVFGMLLIIMSQCVQAAQLTFEDHFMSNMAVPPLKIVGFEGVFGFLAMTLVLMPVVQFLPGREGQGIHEDSLDTLYMLWHTPSILAVVLLDLVALLGLNISGMCVTGHFGAVFRTVLETTRTLAVWLVGLLLYYTPLGRGHLGESWNAYSWIQATGFVVLVAGTVVYGRGDDVEIAEEGLQAEYSDALLPSPAGTGAAAMPVSRRIVTPTAIPISSSLKSTMNISAFSMPSSMGRSAGFRHRDIPVNNGGIA
ncbi:Solute carrier family 35 member F6 [Auxenochlorella protothecoides]|uniref:Solute carrier family 35 member F6 n=1 Tax=Auxenochlorella protothecoides TaxID=3075 RepID=A0A087SGZ6_AUXPR|nr:Solute carrier family 35 member F6 [Auxenochlorella protothecoides]KFM25000.1 Solute carrier family 35 member F6 [Auxenochlorella protothecoides]